MIFDKVFLVFYDFLMKLESLTLVIFGLIIFKLHSTLIVKFITNFLKRILFNYNNQLIFLSLIVEPYCKTRNSRAFYELIKNNFYVFFSELNFNYFSEHLSGQGLFMQALNYYYGKLFEFAHQGSQNVNTKSSF